MQKFIHWMWEHQFQFGMTHVNTCTHIHTYGEGKHFNIFHADDLVTMNPYWNSRHTFIFMYRYLWIIKGYITFNTAYVSFHRRQLSCLTYTRAVNITGYLLHATWCQRFCMNLCCFSPKHNAAMFQCGGISRYRGYCGLGGFTRLFSIKCRCKQHL